MRKHLIQRLSGLLYLHGDSDPLLPWHHVVVRLHLLDHLNLFISISALRKLNYQSTCALRGKTNEFQKLQPDCGRSVIKQHLPRLVWSGDMDPVNRVHQISLDCLALCVSLTQSTTHLPVDPLKLTEVNFRKIFQCDIRKIPGRKKSRVYVLHESTQEENPGTPPSSCSSSLHRWTWVRLDIGQIGPGSD